MNFDASLLVIMVIFWVTYLIVRNYLLKPVLAVLDERERATASAQTVHDEALAETGVQIEGERSRLAAARLEARGRRDEARRKAREERAKILLETRSEAEAELGEARQALAAEVDSARGTLEAQARGLADAMADRLLRKAG